MAASQTEPDVTASGKRDLSRSVIATVVVSAFALAIVPTGFSAELTWFVPVLDALRAGACAVVAAVAFLDVSTRRDPRALPQVVVGTALAILFVAHFVAFPGVVPGFAAPAAGNTTSWLFLVISLSIPSLLAWAVMTRPRPLTDPRRSALTSVAVGVGLGGLGTGIGVALGVSTLSAVSGNAFTTVNRIVVILVLVPVVIAVTGTIRGRGDLRVVGGVIAAVTFVGVAALVDVFVTARYTPVWYSFHLIWTFAPLALLSGSITLYARSVQAELGSLHALSDSNRQLEREGHELRRLQADLAAASNAKSQFISQMSHELRTPLNAIIGFAQLLAISDLPSNEKQNVEEILVAGQHQLAIVNDVVDIALIEAGALRVSIKPLDVLRLVYQAIGLVEPLATSRRVTVAIAGPSLSNRHVLADRQRLMQVLVNVLTNAIKYNRDAGDVVISATGDGDRLRLAVADTGPGISRDKLGRLFEPFDRLGAEETDVEGTGLGLALSQRLMTAMGGSITAQSSTNGSTFMLDLPIATPPKEAPAPAPSGGQRPAAKSDIAGIVLYVEDNLAYLRLVESILARRPAVVLISAMEGGLALDLAQKRRPDLILLDVHLPDMSGHDVLQLLRSDPATASIPVVVVSADDTKRQIDRMLEAGAHSYLTKPLDLVEFLDTVDRLLIAEPASLREGH